MATAIPVGSVSRSDTMVGAAADRWAAAAGVGALGLGVVLALAGFASGSLFVGFASGSLFVGIAGGALAAGALLGLMAGGWLDGLTLLALSLPLPALALGTGTRLPLAAVLAALVVTAWILRRLPWREPIWLGALPRVPTALFLIGVLIAGVFATDRVAAAREVLNLGVLLALLVVATDEIRERRDRSRELVRRLALIAGITGVVAAFQALGVLPSPFPLPGTSFYRAVGGFGWPNELGMFMAVSIPFCVFAYHSAHDGIGRLTAALALGGCLAGLLATFSRGSWLAALMAPAVLILVGGGRSTVRIWMGGALAILVLDLAVGGVVTARATSLVGDYVVEQRAALMLAGLLMFRDHPWVGVGPGNFVMALEEYGPQVQGLWDYVGAAHNGYLHVAAETGVVGLVGLSFLFGGILVRILRRARMPAEEEEASFRLALLWAFTTVCLASMTEWPFAHGLGELVMLLLALIVCQASRGAGDGVVLRPGS